MNNYRIHFTPAEKNTIIRILRSHNDIIIDNIDENSAGITIERDDSGQFYRELMDEIDREIHTLRPEPGVNRSI